jgi:hypothetical protein
MHRQLHANAETLVGLVLLVFSVVYWFQARALPHSALGGSVGASGMPELLAILLGVFSVILTVKSLFATAAERTEMHEAIGGLRQNLRAAGIWLIGVATVIVLPIAGYPVTVALLLFSIAVYYGRRPSLLLVAFSVGGAAVFTLLFSVLLRVPMPLGIWPSLLPH